MFVLGTDASPPAQHDKLKNRDRYHPRKASAGIQSEGNSDGYPITNVGNDGLSDGFPMTDAPSDERDGYQLS